MASTVRSRRLTSPAIIARPMFITDPTSEDIKLIYIKDTIEHLRKKYEPPLQIPTVNVAQ